MLDNLHPALTIIQFTGVYDANGREIWEGDILYWRYCDEDYNEEMEYWREVVFWEGAFGTGIPNEDFDPFCNLNLMAEKVVGNVFENPKILAKKVQ